jgi:hypothetical protein
MNAMNSNICTNVQSVNRVCSNAVVIRIGVLVPVGIEVLVCTSMVYAYVVRLVDRGLHLARCLSIHSLIYLPLLFMFVKCLH